MTTGLTAYAAKYTPAFQMRWIESLESRIGAYHLLFRSVNEYVHLTSVSAVTSSILGSMKAIKITNLTSDVLALLNKIRNDELAAASKFRFLSIATATIGEKQKMT